MYVRIFLILSLVLLFFGCETKLVNPDLPDDDPPPTNELIISEVRVTSVSEDGGFRNTYLEVYNGTGAAVDLSSYGLQYSSNGRDWDESTQLTFSGQLEHGEVIVIARTNTNPALVVDPDYVWEALTANGDDGVALVKDSGSGFVVIDQYGTPYGSADDPGNAWDVAGFPDGSVDYVLWRKYPVMDTNTDWIQSAGTTELNSEWIVREKSDFSNLGTFTPDIADFEPDDPGGGGPGDDPPPTNELIISEVRVTSTSEDGGFRNTYVEVYNGTGSAVDLTSYGLQYSSNGADFDEATQLTFTGSLEDGEVIVIARDNTDPAVIVDPDFVWDALTANGDDGIALVKDSGSGFVIIDQYGETYDAGNDPGSAWDVAGIDGASRDQVLLRKYPVMDPNTDWPVSAGTTLVGSEWIVAAKDDFSNLGTFTPDTVDYIPEGGGGMPPMTNDLIISEVRVTSTSEDGGFRNTYVEVYNGTGATVDLTAYGLQYSQNGADWDEGTQLTFTGSLDDGATIVIARDNTDPAIIVDPDFLWSALTANGDDGIALVKDSGGGFVIIDQYGEPYDAANDPGNGWDIAGVEEASRNQVLLRKYPVRDGNTLWVASAGTTAENSEWIVAPKEDFSNLGTFTPDTTTYDPIDLDEIPPTTSDLIISEVRVTSTSEDGGFRNTYLEVYNGTGSAVDLTAYGVQYSSNGADFTGATQLTFTGMLEHGEVIVIARENTDPAIIVDPDFVWSDLTANGDDGIALVKDSGGGFEIIDQYGESYDAGNDPGNAWDIAGVAGASRDQVLLRKWIVADPNTDWVGSAGTSTGDSEWIVRDKDDFSSLGTFTKFSE